MDKAAVAEIIRTAESGDHRFPEVPLTGLRAESARLDHAQQYLFADGESAAELFLKFTEVAPGSALTPRAERLRLLHRHRTALLKVFSFSETRPHAAALFEALAAGPGPTSHKRHLEASLTRNEHRVLTSEVRLGLAKEAPEVHRAEKPWLKKVGPYRSTSHLETRRERLAEWVSESKGVIAFVSIVAAFFVLMVTVVAMDDGSPPRESFRPMVAQYERPVPVQREPQVTTLEQIMRGSQDMNLGYFAQPPQTLVKVDEPVRTLPGVTLLRPVDPGLLMHTTSPVLEKSEVKTEVPAPSTTGTFPAETTPVPLPNPPSFYAPAPARLPPLPKHSSSPTYFPVGGIGILIYFIIRALKKNAA